MSVFFVGGLYDMTNKAFGLKLKEHRARAGLTQPQLAERAGLSKSTVADLEQGRYAPTWPTVQALAAALGVTPDAFHGSPATDAAPRGRGRPPKAQDTPTAPPRRRTGKKMPGKRKRPPAKGE